MRRLPLLLAGVSFLLAACDNSASVSQDQVATEIEAATQDWAAAYVAGNAARATSFVTDDAVFVPPNEPLVSGRDAIEEWNREFLEEVGIDEVDATVEGIRVAGDWAVSHGSWAAVFSANGESFADTTRYVAVWERQADGSWKVARDIWNSALAGEEGQ